MKCCGGNVVEELVERNAMEYKSGVSDIIRQLAYRGDLKLRFSAMQYNAVTNDMDYGNGELIKMLDAHILKDIDEHPGILSVELAQNWCRTRSAICIIVQRLEDRGYIEKKLLNTNKKERALFITEKGHQLCELHRRHDALRTSAMIDEMLNFCTSDELEAYFKVLDIQIKLMQKGHHFVKGGNLLFDYTDDAQTSG